MAEALAALNITVVNRLIPTQKSAEEPLRGLSDNFFVSYLCKIAE